MAVLCGLVACKRAMVVGEFACPEEVADGAAIPSSDTTPITVPWQTGFENGRCDYVKSAGICYSYPPATFRIVDSPVHTGQYAAEITVVTGTDAGSQPQGRCFRQGVLPAEAYYGAWFLIPKAGTRWGLWDLLYFQRREQPALLWDVQLTNDSAGGLSLKLVSRNFLPEQVGGTVPIGRWFHVVLYLKLAKDATGAVALYLNGQKLFGFTNLATTDSDWGQWYAGNLASNMEPPECTVYMDDVTIRSTL